MLNVAPTNGPFAPTYFLSADGSAPRAVSGDQSRALNGHIYRLIAVNNWAEIYDASHAENVKYRDSQVRRVCEYPLKRATSRKSTGRSSRRKNEHGDF